jgi:long-chain acyl-CoA synthetase
VTEEVWVFDVDGCLIDSLTGTSVRPGAVELLSQLRSRGCGLLLWSAGGAEYARRRAREHGLVDFFDAFHDKEGRDAAGRYVTDALPADLGSLVFVDDRPEDMPVGANVVAVAPYLVDNPHDRALESVSQRVASFPTSSRRAAPR